MPNAGAICSLDEVHKCRQLLSCVALISSIRVHTQQMVSGQCGDQSIPREPDRPSVEHRIPRRRSPDRFPFSLETSGCAGRQSHHAIGPATGRLADVQPWGRAWPSPCCAPGTACRRAGMSLMSSVIDGHVALLLTEPADHIIGMIAKMPPDAASLRTDSEVTPLIKRRLRYAEILGGLLRSP